jgi:hypothetical protein
VNAVDVFILSSNLTLFLSPPHSLSVSLPPPPHSLSTHLPQAFVKGAKSEYNVSIDYLGIWNERSWGNTDYVLDLRASLDAVRLFTSSPYGPPRPPLPPPSPPLPPSLPSSLSFLPS